MKKYLLAVFMLTLVPAAADEKVRTTICDTPDFPIEFTKEWYEHNCRVEYFTHGGYAPGARSETAQERRERLRSNATPRVGQACVVDDRSSTPLNVRKAPSTSGEILGALNNGTTVVIVDTKGDWARIVPHEAQGAKSGWVFLPRLDCGPPRAKIEPPKQEQPQKPFVERFASECGEQFRTYAEYCRGVATGAVHLMSLWADLEPKTLRLCPPDKFSYDGIIADAITVIRQNKDKNITVSAALYIVIRKQWECKAEASP